MDTEVNITPLEVLGIEITELSEVLLASGMPEHFAAQVIANMLGDAIMYRDGPEDDAFDEDDDDEDSIDDGEVQ